LRSAVAGSDERAVLVVLRRKLADRLDSDELPSYVLAQITRQFLQVDAEIRSIDAAQDQDQDQDQDDDDPCEH
jgi:hypothetical protein